MSKNSLLILILAFFSATSIKALPIQGISDNSELLSFISDNTVSTYSSTANLTNIVAQQRKDGSKIVDIYYDLDGTFPFYEVLISASFKTSNARTFETVCLASGDYSFGVDPGNGKHIIWNLGQEYPNLDTMDVALLLSATGSHIPPNYLEWAFVHEDSGSYDAGIDYNYFISKYEITNAQYVAFLESAFNLNDISITPSTINGYYDGNKYFSAGIYPYLNIDNPECRISYSEGNFLIESGYENHPVSEVTYFGAYAFTNHYRLSVPGIMELLKAIRGGGKKVPWDDYAPSCELANYLGCDGGTREVGVSTGGGIFGVFDLVGNVWEWSSSENYNGDRFKVWGGAWNRPTQDLVTGVYVDAGRDASETWSLDYHIGIRAIRKIPPGISAFSSSDDLKDFGIPNIDIQDPVIALTSPNGGEVRHDESEIAVTWQATDEDLEISPISIYGSVDDGEFELLVSGLANTGAAMIPLPYAASSKVRFMVTATDTFGNLGYDVSDDYFEISRIPGSGFSVRITSEYDGNDHPEIVGQFISGIDLINTFTANINVPYDSKVISRVDFNLSGTIITDYDVSDGWGVDINMGSLTEDATLTAQAFDESGYASEIGDVSIDMVSMPSWVFASGNEYEMGFNNEEYFIRVSAAPELALKFESLIADSVLLLGGLSTDITGTLNLIFRAGLDGAANISGNGEILGNIMSPTPDVSNIGTEIEVLASLNDDWSLGNLYISGNSSSRSPTPEVGANWLVDSSTTPLSIDADLGAEILSRVNVSASAEGSLELMDGTVLSSELEIAVDASTTISNLYGVAEVSLLTHPSAVIHSNTYKSKAGGSSQSQDGSFTIPYEIVGSLGWGSYSGVLFEGQLPIGQDAWTFGDPTQTQDRLDMLLARRETILNNIPDVMPSPDMATNNTGQGMLVYMKDRDPVQGSPNPEIYYSIWDGNNYGNPLALTDNEYFESSPNLEFLPNSNALCVWTSNETLAAENLSLSEVLANQELQYSIWDAQSASWSEIQNITSDSFADGLSALSVRNDTSAVVVWTHSKSVSEHAPEDWEIYYAVWNGFAWTPPSGITDDTAADLDPTIAYLDGGDALSVWLSDADHNFETVDDLELKYALWEGTAWSASTKITANDFKESNPQLETTSDGDAYLTWISNELLPDSSKINRIYMSRWDSSLNQWSTPVIIISDDHFIETAEINSTTIGVDEHIALSWRGYDGYDGDVFISFHSLQDPLNLWTEPVQMSSDELADWMLTSAIDANSNLLFVDMKVDYSLPSNQMFRQGNFFDGLNVSSRGIRSSGELSEELNHGILKIKPDLNLGEIAFKAIDDMTYIEQIALNDTIHIQGVVKNIGVVEADSFYVAVFQGYPGSSSTNKIGGCSIDGLKPDSSFMVSVEWIVETGGKYDIHFDIDHYNQISEQREVDNFVSKTISVIPDLIIHHIGYSHTDAVDGDMLTVKARIVNQGGFEASNIPYTISYNDSIYTTLTGNIDNINHGDSITVDISLIPLSGIKPFTITLDPENTIEELDIQNNSATIQIEILPDYEVLSPSIFISTDTSSVSSIQAELHNIGAADGTMIPIVIYDGHPNSGGVLIDSITIQSLLVGDSIEITSDHSLTEGLHSIHFRVNPYLDQVEYNYENNFAAENFLIRSKPDLIIPSGHLIVGGGNPHIGEQNKVQMMVHNLGGKDALKVSVDFYTVDPILESSSPTFSTIIPVIHAKDSVIVETELYIEAGAYGNIPLWTVVDMENNIDESDEASNVNKTILSFYPEIIMSMDSLSIVYGIDSLYHELTFRNHGNGSLNIYLAGAISDGYDIPKKSQSFKIAKSRDTGQREHLNMYGDNWLDFDGDSLILLPQDTGWVGIEFIPQNVEYQSGVYTSIIVIESNDPDTPNIRFPIKMAFQGQAPQIYALSDLELSEDESTTLILDSTVYDAGDLSMLGWKYEILNGGDANFSIHINESRQAAIEPGENWYGTVNISFTATNIYGLSDSDTITVVVTPVNDGPMLYTGLDTMDIFEDEFSSVLINRLENFFIDVDYGDHLFFQAFALQDGLDSLILINDGAGFSRDILANIIDSKIMRGSMTNQNPHSKNISPFLVSTRDDKSKTSPNRTKINRVLARGKKAEAGDNQPSLSKLNTTLSGDKQVNDDNEQADTTSLIVYPRENYSGEIGIVVTATDDQQASISDTLILEIISINDPPGIFQLILPEDSSEFVQSDDTLLYFAWENANDIEGDPISYVINFYSDALDTQIFSPQNEITLNVDYFPRDVWVEWDVYATDNSDATWCDSPRLFKLAPTVGVDQFSILPENYSLEQNYPNPFNPTTSIRYAIPESIAMELVVYDIRGREVIVLNDGRLQSAGWYEINWNGVNKFGDPAPTGLYFAVMQAGNYRAIIKMMHLK